MNKCDISGLSARIIDVMPDMLVLFDAEGTLLDIRRPIAALTDSGSPETMKGRKLSGSGREATGFYMKYFREACRTGKTQQFIYPDKTKEGKTCFYEVFLFRLEDDRILAQIRNIADQTVAEIESEHLHALFAKVLDNVAIPLTVRNADTGRYVYWSKKAENFGRTAAEMIAGGRLDMSAEQEHAVGEVYRRLMDGTDARYEGMEKYVLRDGSEHTFLVTRTVFAFGRERLILSSMLDVSDLAETRDSLLHARDELAMKNMTLSSVLSIARVVPWTSDLKARMFYCDYEAYHHESAPGPDALGRYTLRAEEYFGRIHPDYRDEIIGQYDAIAEGRKSDFRGVYPIHWFNDREWEWVEVQSSASGRGPDGKPLRLIGSVRLATTQKRLEESLREAKEEAERSNMLKSAFLANMSHEIRTPLNAIVGFSELLAHAENEAEKQEYLGIIQNSNALLLQLISDILDLSKIEAGTLEFSMADHDLGAVMDELERTARMKVSDPAVDVACTDRMSGYTVRTDRGRLLQVMHNFIGNAAKFTTQGHIHFGCRRHDDGRWYFYVEDTGCGISSDKAADVFERFVKLDGKMQGTGLGLAISKSIVERLGGEIGVFSSEGRGSTFWFLLPADSVRRTAESEAPAPDGAAGGTASPAPKSILVAEDDPVNYRLLEAILKKDHTLLHAWNGREAVELFREHRPCMILMDIKMPEMDGYEATAAIRSLSDEVPIIAVTAFAYPEDMRRILASGFNGCLPKPVNAEGLKGKIMELCRERRKNNP